VSAPRDGDRNLAAGDQDDDGDTITLSEDASDDLIRQAGALAERRRQQQIRGLGQTFGMPQPWIDRQINADTSYTDARLAALEWLAQHRQPVEGLGRPRIRVGDDGRESLFAAIEDAMVLRAGVSVEKPHERLGDVQHLRLVEIGRSWLGQLGVEASRLDPERVAQLCLNPMQLAGQIGAVALAHSTGDFPGLFANVLNKLLLPAYEEEPSTWELWAQQRLLPDFRDLRLNSLGHIGDLRQVLEGAEYTHTTLGEKFESIRVLKFGRLIALTWEMFVNDDLNAFVDNAFGFAQAARRLENDLAYAEVTSNPTLNEDSTAVFHADHNNLNQGGAGAPALATLDAAREAMALQRGIAPGNGEQGPVLNLRPNVLLVPQALLSTTSQLVASTVDPTKSNNTPNFRFVNELAVVADSRLDADSTTAWYAVAGRQRSAPAAIVAKLRGFERPTIERSEMGPAVDGRVFKVRHVCGAKITDFRPWQKNAG